MFDCYLFTEIYIFNIFACGLLKKNRIYRVPVLPKKTAQNLIEELLRALPVL
jgi:hypothetical protein